MLGVCIFSLSFFLMIVTSMILMILSCSPFCYIIYLGGNEYGQCGEEPSKDETGRPVRRDIVIPKRCAQQLTVRQVTYAANLSSFTSIFSSLFFLSKPSVLGFV